MDHREAVSTEAADRYLLGQMSEEEQRAFEEHYFDCADCAAAVEAGAALAATTAAVFAQSQAPQVPVSSWLRWRWPALAFTSLLLVVGYYELFRLPGHRTAQAYPAFFLPSVARGAGRVLEPPPDARMIGLWFDLPPAALAAGVTHPAYECRLTHASGQPQWTMTVPPPRPAGDTIHLLIPADSPPGDYTLVLSASGREIQRFHFTLKNR
jgi:hypothetical protein